MSTGGTAFDTERGSVVIRLEREEGYRFAVDFGEVFEPFAMDEPFPLGEGSAPNASRVLGAAVGNCLAASLLYCLQRAHIRVKALQVVVKVTPERDADRRLRVGSIAVQLFPQVELGTPGGYARCLEIFEDYCVVTGSVRAGVTVDVTVASPLSTAAAPAADPAAGS